MFIELILISSFFNYTRFLIGERDKQLKSDNLNRIEALRKNFNQRRNSIDLIPYRDQEPLGQSDNMKKTPKNRVKQSLSFTCEKLDEAPNGNVVIPLGDLSTGSSSLSPVQHAGVASAEESGCNWNYDELNELRMKFISLLSDSRKEANEREVTITSKETAQNSLLEANKELSVKLNKMDTSNNLPLVRIY